MNNIPSSIVDKIGQGLYRQPDHPICIVKEKVYEYFSDLAKIEIQDPYTLVEYNFDKLRVPKDHPSRSPSDTFYKDEETLLRTHMTCYLYPMGHSETGKSQLKYITCGDVYRKDAIDATHYPVFHQIDAFCMVPDGTDVKQDLRNRLTGLIKHLFGPTCVYRFLEDSEVEGISFPFTVDSLEIEVELQTESGTKLLEVLGAGTVHPDIMADLGLPNRQAWAFGLGVERAAMALFNIPDIRLFWSNDQRFLSQFRAGQIVKFKPYSKYESCYKDVSLFVNEKFSYNEMCSIIRDEDRANIVESVILIDQFERSGQLSECYRIIYRSVDTTLKNSDINKIQSSICKRLVADLGIQIR